MGSRGGSAPNPYTQRSMSTLFLRVPRVDWARVKIGEKTEFRTQANEAVRIAKANTPTPVVAYSISLNRDHDAQLMVLERHRYEPLFAIAEDVEAIRREGYETYDEFRRYWRARLKGIYRPMQKVHVWRVRPWTETDELHFGPELLKRLYGDFM